MKNSRHAARSKGRKQVVYLAENAGRGGAKGEWGTQQTPKFWEGTRGTKEGIAGSGRSSRDETVNRGLKAKKDNSGSS